MAGKLSIQQETALRYVANHGGQVNWYAGIKGLDSRSQGALERRGLVERVGQCQHWDKSQPCADHGPVIAGHDGQQDNRCYNRTRITDAGYRAIDMEPPAPVDTELHAVLVDLAAVAAEVPEGATAEDVAFIAAAMNARPAEVPSEATADEIFDEIDRERTRFEAEREALEPHRTESFAGRLLWDEAYAAHCAYTLALWERIRECLPMGSPRYTIWAIGYALSYLGVRLDRAREWVAISAVSLAAEESGCEAKAGSTGRVPDWAESGSGSGAPIG